MAMNSRSMCIQLAAMEGTRSVRQQLADIGIVVVRTGRIVVRTGAEAAPSAPPRSRT